MRTNQQREQDEKLRRSVELGIEWDPRILSAHVAVTVSDNVVTLGGFVTNYMERQAAENAALNVRGVKALANEIVVKPGCSREDGDIARDVVDAMRINLTVPDDKISVIVADGFVTLRGAVDWDFQRRAAQACSGAVAGVKGVINNIGIKPVISTTVVSAKIEDALRRNAELDARHITVSAKDGRVFLGGTVRSWPEREAAERAAWAAPGVAEVVDQISVTF